MLLWALRVDQSATVQAIRKLQAEEKLKKGSPVDDLTDRRWGLHELLILARAREILDEHTGQMAELTQGFRNLIHPGKELRDAEEPSREMARMASAALTYVVKQVATWARETAARPTAD